MHRRLSTDRGLTAVLLAVLLGATPAHADEPLAVPDEGTLAERAWREGRFAEAAHRSLDAYRRDPRHTVLLYNAARAFHRAQLCTEALRWYRTYLDLADLEADRRDVAARLADAIAAGVDLDCPAVEKVVALPAPATGDVPGTSDSMGPLDKPRVRETTGPVRAAVVVRKARIPREPSARQFWGWALVGTGAAGLAAGGWLLHDWAGAPQVDDGALRQRDTGAASAGIGVAAAALGLWLLLHESSPEPRLLDDTTQVPPDRALDVAPPMQGRSGP